MHNFLVEMCRSCLRLDVPLFEAMESKANNKKVKNSTVIKNLFRKDIIEEYNWKLCEDCTVLLKGAVLLEKGLLTSKLLYSKYLRLFDGNNHINKNTFSNLSVQIKDIDVTTEENNLVEIKYATVEESTAYTIDECLETEYQVDVDSLEGDVIDTKIKIEIDEANYENILNDFHCVEETLTNIKTDAEHDNILGSTEENMEAEKISIAALLESSSKLLHLNVENATNADKNCNKDNNETEATTLNSEKKLLICSKCNQKFTKKQSLVIHLKAHRDVKSYRCDLCAKVFLRKSHYISHRQIHTGEKPYKCDLCTKTFSRKARCSEHRRIHTGEKPYKCDLCPKSFSHNSHYHRHRRSHMNEKPYKCDLCTKTFSRKSHCDDHNRRIHTGEKRYRCDLCSKAFLNKSQYVRHRRIHTDVKLYKCDLCTKSFSNKSHCNEHRQIHKGEKPYKCNFCAESFSDRTSCKRHKRIHAREKPYKCDLCTKAYSSNSHFNRHRRTHTDEKRYKCDLCTKLFSNKSLYNEHRPIHKGEKRYRCDLCLKSFLNKSLYIRHRRIHIDEKL